MIVYDNFDFKDTVKDQALGSTHEMRHFTTAYAFTCDKVGPQGLTQSMLRRDIPLSELDIARPAARTWERADRSWFNQMRFRTMENTLKEPFKRWRESHKIIFPLPNTEKKSCAKTEAFYLGAIQANSATAEGTAQVHEYLMERELKIPINSSDDIFRNRLFIFHGDQKTVENCRAARIEQEDSECPFNSRDWHLPVPAFFHVVMNLSFVLLRIFWAPVNENGSRLRTTHCVLADMQRFGFKNISQDNAPWYDLHRLTQMGYYSRVFAVFLQCLEAQGMIHKEECKSAKSLQGLMSKLNPIDFDRVWDSVNKVLFSKHAMDGEIVEETDGNLQGEIHKMPAHMTALARFVQTAHVYMVLNQYLR